MSQTGNRNKLLWTVYAPTVFVIVTDEFHTVFASTYLPSVVSVLEAPETLGGGKVQTGLFVTLLPIGQK